MCSNSFLVVNKHPLKMVFHRPRPDTGIVNISCDSIDFFLTVNFLNASLTYVYNELDLDYSLNLSTTDVAHGLTFDELQSILQFYGFASASVCEESA